jgi:hypothetical protein
VTSFGGRALVAFVVVLGLALLDLGPRASAALWLTLTPPATATMGGSGAGSVVTEQGEHTPAVWPPIEHSHRFLHLNGLDASPSGSTGAPSAAPTAGSATPALGTQGAVIAAPALSSFFRATQVLLAPPPPITAVFEPPRGTGH